MYAYYRYNYPRDPDCRYNFFEVTLEFQMNVSSFESSNFEFSEHPQKQELHIRGRQKFLEIDRCL